MNISYLLKREDGNVEWTMKPLTLKKNLYFIHTPQITTIYITQK